MCDVHSRCRQHVALTGVIDICYKQLKIIISTLLYLTVTRKLEINISEKASIKNCDKIYRELFCPVY